MKHIVLLVPALLDAESYLEAEGVRRFEALETLLSRATKQPVKEDSLSALLAKLFAYQPPLHEDMPVAALGRLIDDEKKPDGYWLRADPVHLAADQRSLNLLDINNFSLTQHDALALAACVHPTFKEMGWELEVPVPSRWYVKLPDKPKIRTSELYSVIGRDIQGFMPSGEDAPTWHRIMNELQMCLHNADINTMRSERRELVVNSLWLWGSGSLPALQERTWSRVYSDENCSMGLSMLSNTPCFALPESADELVNEGDDGHLLVVMSDYYTRLLDSSQARQLLNRFENNWCQTLLLGLRENSVQSLRIVTRNTEYTIKRSALRKFWRKTRSLDHFAGHFSS